MKDRALRGLAGSAAAATVATVLGMTSAAQPQSQPSSQQGARPAAPVDITGYWVSVISEDWVYRMTTPGRGDYIGVPLTPAAQRLADNWVPDQDKTPDSQCKAYGAAGLMRQPGRLHITWADQSTLKVEADAGTQTRLFHFDTVRPPAGPPQWQGFSVAGWMGTAATPDARGGRGTQPTTLKVTTTLMRPGYLRLNGVPYSGRATLTEYFDRSPAPEDGWLFVQSVVEDPEYLTEPFITSTNFKREADGSKWHPTPCEATRAVRAVRTR